MAAVCAAHPVVALCGNSCFPVSGLSPKTGLKLLLGTAYVHLYACSLTRELNERGGGFSHPFTYSVCPRVVYHEKEGNVDACIAGFRSLWTGFCVLQGFSCMTTAGAIGVGAGDGGWGVLVCIRAGMLRHCHAAWFLLLQNGEGGVIDTVCYDW